MPLSVHPSRKLPWGICPIYLRQLLAELIMHSLIKDPHCSFADAMAVEGPQSASEYSWAFRRVKTADEGFEGYKAKSGRASIFIVLGQIIGDGKPRCFVTDKNMLCGTNLRIINQRAHGDMDERTVTYHGKQK